MQLKNLISNKNINQTELANAINVSQKTVSNYLSGSTEPTMSALVKMADYFDVSLDYLCERQFNNNVGYIPDERKEAVRALISLSNNNFKQVENFINNLKNGNN